MRIVLCVLMLLSFGVVSAQRQPESHGYRVLRIGTSMRFLQGVDANGITMRMEQDDLPWVLFFFEPGCEMCRAGIVELSALYEQTRSNYHWLGVTADSTRLLEFVQETSVPWPCITVSKKSWEQCQVDATPTLYLTDRKNRIRSGRMVRAEEVAAFMNR
ncbi:MAG: TlpA family protein disulfide reductase [Flavobacteriales bacterium]